MSIKYFVCNKVSHLTNIIVSPQASYIIKSAIKFNLVAIGLNSILYSYG